jgi:hypothetical protein
MARTVTNAFRASVFPVLSTTGRAVPDFATHEKSLVRCLARALGGWERPAGGVDWEASARGLGPSSGGGRGTDKNRVRPRLRSREMARADPVGPYLPRARYGAVQIRARFFVSTPLRGQPRCCSTQISLIPRNSTANRGHPTWLPSRTHPPQALLMRDFGLADFGRWTATSTCARNIVGAAWRRPPSTMRVWRVMEHAAPAGEDATADLRAVPSRQRDCVHVRSHRRANSRGGNGRGRVRSA